MKTATTLCLLFFLTAPAFSELTKIDNANEPFDPFWIVMIIILTAIILPQIIILYKERSDQKELQTQQQQMQTQIDQLRKELEAMQQ